MKINKQKNKHEGKIVKKSENDDKKKGRTSSSLKSEVITAGKKSNVKKKKKVIKKTEKKGRKNYSPEEVQRALEAISQGIALRKAADTYGVPASTLCRKIKHPEKINSKIGSPTVLTQIEEEDIVNWAIYRAEKGFPISKGDLLDSVQLYIKELKRENPFTEGRPGRHWYEAFQKRHPQLTIRTAQTLTLTRASVTEEDLRKWFAEIREYLESKNLLDIHPSQVFNCDETNVQLCPKPEKVLAARGARTVYKVEDAFEKESMTALFMYNAEGKRAPPMILYPYAENVPKKVLDNVPTGWGIGISDSGWMTAETFYEYMTNVFYPWLIQEKILFPVLVYLDGHSSHVTIPLVSFCRKKSIELISLYPNSTHIIQPLDIAFFHPFKGIWRRIVPKWKVQNNITRLKKEHFPAVLKYALDSFGEEKNVVSSGFRGAGLMPFDPEAVDYDVVHKKKKTSLKKSQQPDQLAQSDNFKENQKSHENVVESSKSHLQTFESNISSSLLEEFRNAKSSGQWSGSMDQKGLFEYWLSVQKNSPVDCGKAKPSIRSITTLDNHNLVIIHKPVKQIATVSTDQRCEPIEKEILVLNYDSCEDPVEMVATENNQFLTDEIIILKETPEDSSLLECLYDPIIIVNDSIINNMTEENLVFPDEVVSYSSVPVTDLSDDKNLTHRDPVLIEQSQKVNINIADNSTHIESKILQENVQHEKTVQTQIVNEDSDTNVETSNEVMMDKENNSTSGDKENSNDTPRDAPNSFDKVFTMPLQYLPKKKKAKFEKTGRTKLPSAGTSDGWWKIQQEKEQAQKLKEEKAKKKKQLQEEKRKIAEEKKLLDKKIKEIQMKIKQETV